MKKVLITGGNGQLGQTLAQVSWPDDVHIFSYNRVQFDICNHHQIREVFNALQPDVLINSAAYTAVDKAEDEPDRAYSVNEFAVTDLGSVCKDHGIPMIHISTDYVFSGEKQTAYCEQDSTNPCSIYGASKLAGEESLKQILDEHVIIRTSGVYSRYGHNFVKAIIRAYLSNKDNLRVVNDQVCGPTWTGDIADAIIRITQIIWNSERKDLWGTYHFTSTPAVSWFDFAREIIGIIPEHLRNSVGITPILSSEYPTRARRPHYSILDCSKLENIFGINQPTWNNGLVEVVPSVIGAL